jgi:plastocyanin
MTTDPNSRLICLRLRTVISLLLFITALVTILALIGSPLATARPTPTPRPRATPCEQFPPQTYDVTVGQGLSFVPSILYITEGDTVCWTWTSNGHSVTSGINCMANGWFCSPDDMNCSQGILSNTGTKYCVTFFAGGLSYYYFCAAHCTMGMTGVINVGLRPRRPGCP